MTIKPPPLAVSRVPTTREIVQTQAEAALYLVAVRHPGVFAEAEREAQDFPCAMLAEDQDALRRVKAILDGGQP